MAGLTRRAKLKQIREAHREYEEQIRRIARDPGLRDDYAALPRAPIRVVACPMGKFANQGGIIRLAEAFRIEHVYLATESRGDELSGATGIQKWQSWEWLDPLEAVRKCREDGLTVYGLDLDESAQPVESVDWQFPCALVLGEERHGITPDVRDLCDGYVAIPMYGLMGSINVAASCAVALNAMVRAYSAADPHFEPARNASRRLLGLREVNYQESETTESGGEGSDSGTS